MNIGNILNFITENNIEPEQVFALVEKIKNTDLSNENNIRDIIHEVSLISGKSIDKNKEDSLVTIIMQNGINEDLLNLL